MEPRNDIEDFRPLVRAIAKLMARGATSADCVRPRAQRREMVKEQSEVPSNSKEIKTHLI